MSNQPEDPLYPVLDKWKQGDCTLDFQSAFYFSHMSNPLSEAARELAASGKTGEELVEIECVGVMVLTQTCDIIRNSKELPTIEICPLVEVPPEDLENIKKWGKPLYIYVPALADKRLVADLSKTMTVEKSYLAIWQRIDGFPNTQEQKLLMEALSRKVNRFAFPDNLNPWVVKLKKKLRDKIDKSSEDGEIARAVSQVRLQAHPNWGAAQKTVHFYILLETDVNDTLRAKVRHYVTSIIEQFDRSEEFIVGDIHVKHYREITAENYLDSELLDVVLLS